VPQQQFTVSDPANQQWLAAVGHSPDSFITAVRLMHQRLFPPQLQWTDQDFNSLKYAGIGKIGNGQKGKKGWPYLRTILRIRRSY
jgi:hypothetical protein